MESLEMISNGLEEPYNKSEESQVPSVFDDLGCARETEQSKWPPLTQQ